MVQRQTRQSHELADRLLVARGAELVRIIWVTAGLVIKG